VIVNPAAGGGSTGRLVPEVSRRLADGGRAVRTVDTRDLPHARELAAQAARAGETVVAFGGDGLVGAAADALRQVPGSVLGVLPGGRGNDLARVLGIPGDPLAACATILEGAARAIDLGEVTGADGRARTFVGIASAGFDSDANRIANEAPSWLGGLVYSYGALRALLRWRPVRFEIALAPSGERHELTGYTVAVANSRAYGGGMMMAPHAMLDDGQLEVIAVGHVGALRFLANLPRVFKGTHVELPSVRAFRAAEVRVSAERPFTMYADGDPIGELPASVRALPGAVAVLVPRQPAPGSALSPLPPPADSATRTETGAA
jgi:YegS/Rv2252/BmrU family lipid kinase